MCTLSWTPLPHGYALAMNRDEHKNRARGTPPALREAGGVPVLCPSDGQAGGTWLATNALGHSVALLNRYEDAPHDDAAGFVSRGLLVLELAGTRGPRDLDAALGQRSLDRYHHFTLASLVPGVPPRLYEWNGHELKTQDVPEPGLLRASSGMAQAEAERERSARFREAAARPGGLTPGVLADLHRSHLPRQGPLSICMHRDDAVTVSFSLVTVTAATVTFHHLEGSPCGGGPVTELSLPLSAEPHG